MKVFIPVTDSLLENGTLESEKLVPFNPDYLAGASQKHIALIKGRSKEGVKPSNWIEESDYATACARLRNSPRLVTA